MVTITEDGAALMVDAVPPRKVKARAVFGRLDDSLATGGAITSLANLAFANYRISNLPASRAKPIAVKTVHGITAVADVTLYGAGGGGLAAQGNAAFAATGPDKAAIRAFFAVMDEAKLGIVINSPDSYYRLGWTFYDHLTDIPDLVFTRSTAAPALDLAGARHDFAVNVPRETDSGWLLAYGGMNLVKAYQDHKIGLNGLKLEGGGTPDLVDVTADIAGTKYAAFFPDGKGWEIDNRGDLVNSCYLQFDSFPTTVDETYTFSAILWVMAPGMTARTDVTNAPTIAEQATSSLIPVEVSASFTATSTGHQPYIKASPGSWIRGGDVHLKTGYGTPTVPILAERPAAFVGHDAGNLVSNGLDPTDLTGMTKRGDAASSASVVDDTARVKLRDMLPDKTTLKVYRLDNSAGAASANQIHTQSATIIGETYVPFAWVRLVSGAAVRLGIDAAPALYNEVSYSDDLWKLIEGEPFQATSTSAHNVYVKTSAASVADHLYQGLWHGSALPDTIRGLALTAPEFGDDQVTVPVPTGQGLNVEWLGMTSPADVVDGVADIGASGDGPWIGNAVKVRSRRTGEAFGTATPQQAVAYLKTSFTKRFGGSMLDMSAYPTLIFSDEFDAVSWGDSDSADMTVKKWAGPGHSTYGGSTFIKPSADIYGIYSLINADGGKALRIQAVKVGGRWYSGGLSTINDAGEGFTFGVGTYCETRVRMQRGKAGWAATWKSNQATAANDHHAEIDDLEFYWSDTGDPDTGEGAHEHGTGHAWKPYPVIGSFVGTHWQASRVQAFTFDPTAWYNFGLAITDKWVIWYRDGVETRRMPLWPEVRLRGFHQLLTLAILSEEASMTDGPLAFDISHFKVWQQAA